MEKARNITLVAVFLGLIVCVPITQAVLDLLEDETPQFFELFDFDCDEEQWFFDRINCYMSPERLRTFETDMEEHSWFEENLRPVFQVVRYMGWRDMGHKALPGRGAWTFFHPGVKYLTEPYYRELPPGTVEGGDPVEVIADFGRQLADQGIELLVVPVPGKVSIYPDRLTRWVDPDPRLYDHTRRFAEELKGRGLQVLDLHAVLANAREAADATGRPLYMATDTHWTGDGARLAAEAVAGWVRTRSWYTKPASAQAAVDGTQGDPEGRDSRGEGPGESGTSPDSPAENSGAETDPVEGDEDPPGGTMPGFVRREVYVERRGDIPKMTKMPFLDSLFTTESVPVWRVTDRAGQPYADDPGAPILVLGDSFSRVFQTDEPEAAGWIANLAFELQQPVASIVNDGGASTLVRQQLARQVDLLKNKKLVIWAFVERDIRFGMRGWQPIELVEAADRD